MKRQKIVLAFDSFKGCMTAKDACHAAALAIHEVLPDAETVECPLSDGGEGLVDCVEQMLPVRRVFFKAHDPLMNVIDASYVIYEYSTDSPAPASLTLTKPATQCTKIAYMEMASTSGLPLVPMDKRNPLLTTTYGVGDMIIDATRKCCREIVIGIGGSATCDGGRGMIESIRNSEFKIQDLPHITIASDVTNPLYGRQGAAYIFAPQKGATPEQVVLLDEQLRAFAKETEDAGLASPALADYPGAGAAGGLGYGLMAHLKAEIKQGIDIILDIRDFNSIINDATLIITGEGKSDEQTLMGKVPYGVLKRARNNNIPVWILSGCIDDKDNALSENFDLVKSINDGDNRPLDILTQPSIAIENMKNTIGRLIANYNLSFNL